MFLNELNSRKAKKKVRGSTNGTTVSRVGRSDFFFFRNLGKNFIAKQIGNN